MPAADASAEPFRLAPRAFIARHFAPKPSTKTTASSASSSGPNSDDAPKRPPAPHVLGTGAIVFDQPLPTSSASGASTATAAGDNEDNKPPPPRVLLVQRAPHDSMPLKWEVPGGGCDEDDPSILHSCARELLEEAGLRATAVGPLIRCPASSAARKEEKNKTTTTTFSDAAGPREGEGWEPAWGEHMGGQFFFSRSGKLVCKFQFVVEVERRTPTGSGAPEVRLDPNEHFAYVWATEAEVRAKAIEAATNPGGIVRADGTRADETALQFASREQWDVVLDAFQLWKGEGELVATD
ncbi:hypothetical protein Micbo1qcDRAFT_215248 [Microdochium bolleyi]|uniref:Nudix hydrolase domain-containing protein n=1 Tax=Microdochium bolleyi TaxID=196109 RepID=A0A136ISS4_9PEZI|nr:hypothetical protein Micbo1qcDRAFT_215248 [Microdochium bolleyi]